VENWKKKVKRSEEGIENDSPLEHPFGTVDSPHIPLLHHQQFGKNNWMRWNFRCCQKFVFVSF
jgi:hypothetical protein